MMKKRNLVVLVLIGALLGGVVTGGAMTVFGVRLGNFAVLTGAEYADYKTTKEKYGKLDELQDYINQNYYIPVDQEQLKIGEYKGLFAGIGDPYSAYLTKEEYDAMMVTTSGEFQGIGVTLSPDKNGYIEVVAPIDDTPAAKAGIVTGDKIVKVDGKSYTGETIDNAVAAMKGKSGTEVTVTVLRGDQTLDLKMRRANIVMKTVKSEVLQGDLGYIRISSFDEKTSGEFKDHLSQLEKSNVKGLVLDLRSNPGGVVEECVKVADMLLDKGTVVYTEDSKGKKEYYKTADGKTRLPYVVLVDGGSASASEILAAGIQDNGGGKLIGTKTYGKGIIQSIQPLPNGDAVKLTIMQYFSPKGHVIHKKGIEPDIEIELTEADFVNGVLPRENDKQLQKAVEVLMQEIK